MILFHKVRYKNFLSTGNAWTEVWLHTHPLNLIMGTNGSGKSTVLDAICWGLFGKAFRKINKAEVINSINEKECEVEVTFYKGPVEYVVHRGVKPNTLSVTEQGNSTFKTVEEILGIDYKTFTQLAILGKASYVPFMQLEAKDRRSLVEEILDIRVFTTMNKILKDRNLDVGNRIGAKQAQYTAAEVKLNVLKQQAKSVSAATQDRINELISYLAIAHQQEKTLTSQRDGFLVPASEQGLLFAKQRELQKLEIQIKGKQDEAVRYRSFFQSHAECPTCTQSITQEARDEQINKASANIARYEVGLIDLRTKVADVDNQIKKVQERHAECIRLNVDISKNSANIANYDNELKKLQSEMPDELLTAIDDAEKECNKLSDEHVDLVMEQTQIGMGLKILKDDGVKASIIRQYLPLINKFVNEYLKAMDFFVGIEFDEEFNETIKARHRDTFSYEHFSEGERMRIDLALLLTWRKIAKMKSRMDVSLLILDEVFDSSLDEAGIDGFMKLLTEPEWQDRNVFVISHKGDMMTDKFDKVITFDKVGNFSRIAP